jgi:hypothetical protein
MVVQPGFHRSVDFFVITNEIVIAALEHHGETGDEASASAAAISREP